jgi:DNA-binding NtrC family response regulator
LLPVVVVEDEASIRRLAVSVLERAGLVTLQASDAAAGLLLLEQMPGACVLFTDCNMPGTMDGLALVAAVHERWPDLPILVTSGQRPSLTALPGGALFLAKPYRQSVLREIVLSMADTRMALR